MGGGRGGDAFVPRPPGPPAPRRPRSPGAAPPGRTREAAAPPPSAPLCPRPSPPPRLLPSTLRGLGFSCRFFLFCFLCYENDFFFFFNIRQLVFSDRTRDSDISYVLGRRCRAAPPSCARAKPQRRRWSPPWPRAAGTASCAEGRLRPAGWQWAARGSGHLGSRAGDTGRRSLEVRAGAGDAASRGIGLVQSGATGGHVARRENAGGCGLCTKGPALSRPEPCPQGGSERKPFETPPLSGPSAPPPRPGARGLSQRRAGCSMQILGSLSRELTSLWFGKTQTPPSPAAAQRGRGAKLLPAPLPPAPGGWLVYCIPCWDVTRGMALELPSSSYSLPPAPGLQGHTPRRCPQTQVRSVVTAGVGPGWSEASQHQGGRGQGAGEPLAEDTCWTGHVAVGPERGPSRARRPGGGAS